MDGRRPIPEGRRQRLPMLAPGEQHPCSGCSSFTDNIGNLAHLHARDTTLALVSRAPLAEITAFKARMGYLVRHHVHADFGRRAAMTRTRPQRLPARR